MFQVFLNWPKNVHSDERSRRTALSSFTNIYLQIYIFTNAYLLLYWCQIMAKASSFGEGVMLFTFTPVVNRHLSYQARKVNTGDIWKQAGLEGGRNVANHFAQRTNDSTNSLSMFNYTLNCIYYFYVWRATLILRFLIKISFDAYKNIHIYVCRYARNSATSINLSWLTDLMGVRKEIIFTRGIWLECF